MNKLTQVGNWKGERQKQTQRFRDHEDKRDQDPDCGITEPIAFGAWGFHFAAPPSPHDE